MARVNKVPLGLACWSAKISGSQQQFRKAAIWWHGYSGRSTVSAWVRWGKVGWGGGGGGGGSRERRVLITYI